MGNRTLDIIKSVFQKKSSSAPMTRDHLVGMVELAIGQHQVFVDSVSGMEVQLRSALREKITEIMNSGNDPWCNLYKKFVSGLQHNAKTLESKSIGGSLFFANQQFIEVLSKVVDNIEKIFPTKTIGIQNITTTMTMFFGFLELSNKLSAHSVVLWGQLLNSASDSPSPAPAFYLNGLSAYMDSLIQTVNVTINGDTVISFDKLIEKTKKDGLDLYLIGQDSEPNALISKLDTRQSMYVTHGLIPLNLSWIGEILVLVKNVRIRKMEDEREWLSAQIELYKLKVSGVDPNSAEYRRLVNIIERYTTILAKHERKIEQYRKGEA